MRMLNKILVGVILLAFVVSAGGTTVNSNSRIADGIEYYIQTDKFTYQLGEEVQMLYKITNLSDEEITISSAGAPPWLFLIQKNTGEEVWSEPTAWLLWIVRTTIGPGEYKLFPPDEPLVWNMQNKAGEIVAIGNYNVFGGIYGPYAQTSISVPIEIIPEPSTFLLITLGVMWPRLIRRSSHNNRSVR